MSPLYQDFAPACRAYRSTFLAIGNNTNVAILFDAERFDNNDMHSISVGTTRITFNRAGVYDVGGNIEWAANLAGTRSLSIRLNGTITIAQTYMDIDSAIGHNQNVHTIYKFAAADYVELVAYQNSGAGLNVNGAANYSPEFWAAWVSAA